MFNKSPTRCAIYTRKSSEEGIERAFNSLDAQREACEAYISSLSHEEWSAIPTRYDDGGFSGGNLQRPALKKLLTDIEAKLIDAVIVYKVDRLTRSLADFSKLVERFDRRSVGFLAVSQPFNTTTSIGRLTLNVLLSFAEFELDVTGERIRDKIRASKHKGMWMGGSVPLGYEAHGRSLVVNVEEAALVREIFRIFLKVKNVNGLRRHLEHAGRRTKRRLSPTGEIRGDKPFRHGTLVWILGNPIYLGEIEHRGRCYPGLHRPIIDRPVWSAAQTILEENRKISKKSASSREPYLLRGLLFDQNGNRFLANCTKKKGKTYRYYVNKVLTDDIREEGFRVVRLPASKIEGAVLSEITLLLKSRERLLTVLVDNNAASTEMHSEVEKIKEWTSCTPMMVRSLLEAVLQRVTVQRDQIEIRIDKQSLRRAVFGRYEPVENVRKFADVLILDVTARLHRSSTVRMLVPPIPLEAKQSAPTVLLHSIAKGCQWFQQILNGEIASTCALAKRTGLTERDIDRLLRLAFIAPDIIETILEGATGPPSLLDCYFKQITMNWEEQRVMFRIPGYYTKEVARSSPERKS